MAPPPNQMLMRVYHLSSTTSPLGMIPERWYGSRMAVESVRQCNGRNSQEVAAEGGITRQESCCLYGASSAVDPTLWADDGQAGS